MSPFGSDLDVLMALRTNYSEAVHLTYAIQLLNIFWLPASFLRSYVLTYLKPSLAVVS